MATEKQELALAVPSEDSETIREAANLMVTGDISKMTMPQKAAFLYKLAKAEGIPPFPPPYAIGKDNSGREKIISTKNRSESLRKRDGISTEILYSGPLRMGRDGDKVLYDHSIYEVEVKGSTRDGRSAVEKGMNFIGELGKPGAIMGQERVNKILGAVTKAANRVTNSLSGSGLMDETEAESVGWRPQVVPLEGPRMIQPPPVNNVVVQDAELVPSPSPLK